MLFLVNQRKMLTSIPFLILVFLSATFYVLPLCNAALGCDRTYSRSVGTLKSPNLEGVSTKSTYENDLTCTYDIKLADSSKGIRLTWSKFDVNGIMPTCSKDYVEIFIGCKSQSIGKYCSSNLVGGIEKMFDVYSPDNCLRIKFHSDGSGTGKGFEAAYFSVQKTMGLLSDTCSRYRKDYTKKADVISSPNWPAQYPSSRDCYWAIEVGEGNGVKIAFMDFDLEKSSWSGCEDIKLKVKGSDVRDSYDSATTIKGSTCGSKDPFVFHSSKKLVWIRFKNDRPKPGKLYRGFVLGYVKYKKSGVDSGGSVVPVVLGLVVAAVVFCCVGCYCYRKRRFQGQRVPSNPPVQTNVTVTVPPPTQSYPMQPVAKGDPPPPSYSQATSGSYYPPPGVQPGQYPPPSSGGAYPPGQPGGGMYPPPPPGGAYPYGPPPPGEPYSAPPPSAPYANPGEAAPYPATAPPYPPTSGTAPYPTS